MLSPKIKTSFAAFSLATRQRTIRAKQNVSIKTGWLFRHGMQKCLVCSGIATLSHGKVISFYPKGESYPHVENCTNK